MTLTKHTLEDVIAELERYVDSFPTKGDAANALGVSRAYLWRVLNERTDPPPSILEKIGYRKERVISYEYFKDA